MHEILEELDGFPHCQDAHQYALDVINGTIPNCTDVIAACRRQFDDLNNSNFPYVFDPEKGERAVRFIETLPHVKGKWSRHQDLIKLEPWQKFIIVCIFGWVDEDNLRRFSEAYIRVARKNGKSTLAAAIALYMFCADNEPGAEVYCGATTEKQAHEVFKPARLMCKRKPLLKDKFGIEINAKNLSIVADGSKFEPVVGNPGDGSSPHLWIVDEYHEHPNNDQVDTAITGMGAREQPLLLMITTAGTDTSSPCYDKDMECRRIVNKLDIDEATEKVFALMYGVDNDDDWMTAGEYVLQKANPNYNVSVGGKYLKIQLANALRKASNQNKFRIKHLNEWVNAKEAWLSAQAWRNCGNDELYEGDYIDLPCVIALDLASKRDICSQVRVYYEDKEDGRHYYVFGNHYLPEDRVFDDDANHSYQGWVLDGWLIQCGELETDLTEVEDDVIKFMENCNVREVTYDPMKATQMAQRLEKQSAAIELVEFKQNAIMMSPAMDEAEAAIYSGRLHHDNCPVMTWMAGNTVAKPYKTDFKVPTKEKPHNKIDGIVAMIMGVGRAMYDGDGPGSVYDDRGVREL